MGVTLELLREPDIPLEAESINPSLTALSIEKISGLDLWQGKARVKLGEWFRVSRDAGAPDELRVFGDLSRVKRLGQNTSAGRLIICGDAGMHTGEGMSGGEIEVRGSVGNWSFCWMCGGLVTISGSAGAFLAAAFPGDVRGMKGGTIIVDGDVGTRAAERMRRGLVVVRGRLGEFAAAEMIAGTVVSLGRLEARAAASMKRGTLIVLGEHEAFLPGFEYACTYAPTFTRLLGRHLLSLGVEGAEPLATGARFGRWCGDLANLGKGEILVHER